MRTAPNSAIILGGFAESPVSNRKRQTEKKKMERTGGPATSASVFSSPLSVHLNFSSKVGGTLHRRYPPSPVPSGLFTSARRVSSSTQLHLLSVYGQEPQPSLNGLTRSASQQLKLTSMLLQDIGEMTHLGVHPPLGTLINKRQPLTTTKENRRRSRHHHRHSGSTHTMALARCSPLPVNHLIKEPAGTGWTGTGVF